jgi:DNA-binding transcriptional regulator LsrR (DeoR family)
MTNENPADEFTEKIKILATDDEKIKSFGELFTNDSSREILQLLFNEELTANQIAQKTGISLQLVKYHLIKLQDLGIVKISKIEKNSKSQDIFQKKLKKANYLFAHFDIFTKLQDWELQLVFQDYFHYLNSKIKQSMWVILTVQIFL